MSAVKVKKNEEPKNDIPKVVVEEDNDKEAEKEFDGGFFSVKSPVQKPKSPATSPKSPLTTRSPNTPSRSPASAGITKSTGGDRWDAISFRNTNKDIDCSEKQLVPSSDFADQF